MRLSASWLLSVIMQDTISATNVAALSHAVTFMIRVPIRMSAV